MGGGQHGFSLTARFQHIGIGLKAGPDDLWRVIGQKAIALGRGAHGRFDAGHGFFGGGAGDQADAAIHLTPGGGGRCPITAANNAGVEFDRVLDVGIPGIGAGGFVQGAGMGIKRLDQHIGGHDGIAAILRDRDMHWNPAHAQAKPDGAGLAAGDGMAGGFRHQRGIGTIAAQQR